MSKLLVGAQTIPWGETIRDKMEEILVFLHQEDYAGVETGMRHFDPTHPEYYQELYRRLDITPLGLHSGGQFWDPDAAVAERNKLFDSAQFAAEVGFRYLVVSGNKDETVSSMMEAAETYARLGRRCHELGLRVAYHNHNWELAHNAEILDTLVKNTDASEVSLVLDVAWAHLGGIDLATLLDRFGNRVAYVHLKDVGGDGRFCELGTGKVDLDAVLSLVIRAGIPWLVLEQDYTEKTPEESMRVNRAWLRTRSI